MLDHGVTFEGSTKVLNDTIRKEVTGSGGAWTRDLVKHRHVRLRPRYDQPEDALAFAPLYRDFLARYGISIELNAETPAGLSSPLQLVGS
jgi:hypothetical protein